MRKRNYLYALYIITQLLVALSPVIPGINNIWGDSPDSITVLSVNFATIGIFLLLAISTETKPIRDSLEAAFQTKTNAEWLKSEEFYSRFAAEVKTAKNFVDIAYLAAYPPEETGDEDRIKYYRDLAATVRKKSKVTFRRIVRSSKKNEEWIKLMLRNMANVRNFDMAMIDDHEEKEHSLALSVQIIDNKKTWLVALKSHESRGVPRDLEITDRVTAEGFRDYYERIWNRGILLMRSGNLTEAGKTYVQKAANS